MYICYSFLAFTNSISGNKWQKKSAKKRIWELRGVTGGVQQMVCFLLEDNEDKVHPRSLSCFKMLID